MQIKFRRKSNMEWLCLFAVFMPFLFFMLMDVLRLPGLVKYTIDFAWLLLFLGLVACKRPFHNRQTQFFAIILGLWTVFTTVGVLANFQSPLYYLWGIRNNVRFFVFFFACIFFVRERSVEHYLNFFDKIFWLNFPIVLFQYFVLGLSGDFLGGLFGVEKGCNGYMNIFLVIVVSKAVLQYMNYQEKASRCFAVVAAALTVAILAEMKAFIIEVLVIVFMSASMTKFSLRKLWIYVGTVVGVVVAAQMIAIIFPVFEGWFSIDRIMEIVTTKSGYTLRGDLNRMTVIPEVWKRFLTSPFKKIFGLGLGNCDYASFDFLTTPFYLENKYLNYTWFSTGFMLLETGLVGLILYVSFFAGLFFVVKKRGETKQSTMLWCGMAKIMSVMCLVFLFINPSMRTEAAYMAYFILALPFINSERTSQPEQHLNG